MAARRRRAAAHVSDPKRLAPSRTPEAVPPFHSAFLFEHYLGTRSACMLLQAALRSAAGRQPALTKEMQHGQETERRQLAQAQADFERKEIGEESQETDGCRQKLRRLRPQPRCVGMWVWESVSFPNTLTHSHTHKPTHKRMSGKLYTQKRVSFPESLYGGTRGTT